ncbi:MAG: DUF3999 family protein [Dokdonella sp.]
MKIILALIALLALPVQAAQTDYAFAWPLATSGDASVWQVELTPAMLAASRDPQLADIDVFNAAGVAVPVSWLPVDLAAIALSDTVRLPLFAVPATDAKSAPDAVHLQLQRDADGHLRTLDVNVDSLAAATDKDLILDASAAVRDGGRLDRLLFDWPASASDLRLRIAVDASDDLENWRNQVPAATVLQLRRDGTELVRRAIDLNPPASLPYWRLRFLDGMAPAGLEVHAERIAASAQPRPQRQWIDIEGHAANAPPDRSVHEYSTAAPLAVQALDIALTDDNSVAALQVFSRADASEPWRPRGGITAFRLRDGASALVNDPLQLSSEERASDWRIESRPALTTAPGLQVGYRPDRLVFLAQGEGPYRLAVGSATQRRSEAPVSTALIEVRQRNGGDWQPPLASSGDRADISGDAAYAKPAPPLPWKSWLLWAVLLLGAIIVSSFALSLLRQPKPPL